MNTCSTRSLLQSCAENGVRHFVFSSTAAVYGILASGYASEDTPTAPINPYGTSKLMSEWMLRDLSLPLARADLARDGRLSIITIGGDRKSVV